MNDLPFYRVDGKKFKRVAALCDYLARKHNAGEVSGIGSDRTLRLYAADRKTVIASYVCTPPKLGSDMFLTVKS